MGAGSEGGDGGNCSHAGALPCLFERCGMEMRNEKRKSASRTPVTDLLQPDCGKQMATRLIGTGCEG